jgi:hypothetical protein
VPIGGFGDGEPAVFQPVSNTPFNFSRFENIHIFAANVSSRGARRNNSPTYETIFGLWCRRPETLAH